MNLGFWIAWFQNQKLKIFPFEYLVLKAGIPGREKDFCPSSWDWFEGFFFYQGLNWNVLNWGIELKKDIESWRGELDHHKWHVFTTPNKENRTLQLHPPSDFFPFFSAIFLSHHAWFLELKTTFLLPHFKGSSWPYGRKEKSHTFL